MLNSLKFLLILAIVSILWDVEGVSSLQPVEEHLPSIEDDVCLLNTDLILEPALKIASWNAQRFGKKKVENPVIANYMARIMVRYDIIVIQEVSDSSQTAVVDFLHILNEMAYINSSAYLPGDVLKDPIPDLYDVAVSDRVGTEGSSYKEQYVYFYRVDVVSLEQFFHFEDMADQFKYDPFVAVFRTPSLELERIAFISIHTSPNVAETEIDALFDVYNFVAQKAAIEDVIILGDFNAGCSYVTSKEWPHIRLFTDPKFSWLISDHVDTTTKSTTCPYDRIVVSGSALVRHAYGGSARPFYFDEVFDILDEELVKDISDHYPVELLIRGRVKTKLEPVLSVSVDVKTSRSSVQQLRETCVTARENVANATQSKCQELNADKNLEMSTTQTPIEILPNPELEPELSTVDSGNVIVHCDILDYETQLMLSALCGGYPQVLFYSEDILYLSFEVEESDEIKALLENLQKMHPCVVSKEAVTILEHKLNNGVLRDAALYLQDPTPRRILTIFCKAGQCQISIEAKIQIV